MNFYRPFRIMTKEHKILIYRKVYDWNLFTANACPKKNAAKHDAIKSWKYYKQHLEVVKRFGFIGQLINHPSLCRRPSLVSSIWSLFYHNILAFKHVSLPTTFLFYHNIYFYIHIYDGCSIFLFSEMNIWHQTLQ